MYASHFGQKRLINTLKCKNGMRLQELVSVPVFGSHSASSMIVLNIIFNPSVVYFVIL